MLGRAGYKNALAARELRKSKQNMEPASEQTYRLADTTFRVRGLSMRYSSSNCLLNRSIMQNVEDLVGDLKSLTAAAKLYQKAMEGMLI